LFVERLERRALLAGNVTVSVSGGNLLVRGDNNDNQIAIFQLDDGQYAVGGLTGTTVNGGPVVVRSGIRGNIDVDLKSGDDVLGVGNDTEGLVAIAERFGVDVGDISGLVDLLEQAEAPAQMEVPRNLTIKTNNGDDAVAIIADVGRRIEVNLGNGDNALVIDPTLVGDDIIVRAGSGSDTLEVVDTEVAQMLDVNLGNGANDVLVENSSVGQSAVITTGSGNDYVDIADVSIDDNLVVRTGGGHDDVFAHSHGGEGMDVDGTVDIDTNSGNDYVEFSGSVGVILKIRTGNGNDGVGVFDAEVGDDLNIDTGAGNDDESQTVGHPEEQTSGGVNLENVTVHDDLKVTLGNGFDSLFALGIQVDDDARVDAGSGNDVVEIEDSNVDDLFTALMGSGDDFLEICNSTAGRAELDGGAGEDELSSDFDLDNLPPGFRQRRFEIFSDCEDDE
jgi:hypothetical protein